MLDCGLRFYHVDWDDHLSTLEIAYQSISVLFDLFALPIQFFFLVNYVFSSNDRNETYDYQYGITNIQGDRGPRSSKKGRSTTIHLEDRKYEAYYFPRMFFNY